MGEFCYCGHAAAVVSKPRVENRRFFIFVAPNFSLFLYREAKVTNKVYFDIVSLSK